MADVLTKLDARVAQLRELQRVARDELPRELGRVVERHVLEAVRAGRSPDGEPWPRREDGARALDEAADGIRVDVSRATVTVSITKRHLELHHLGRARGGIRRPLLPTTITPRLRAALDAASQRVIERALAGAS
jgi:hypothetical protein